MSNRTTTDRALLVYAVRYALGRQSYAVGQVCDEVKRLAPVLDANERGVLVRDIAEALKRADDHGETLGMQMDHDEWKATLAALGASTLSTASPAPASPQEPEVIIAPPGTRHPLSDLYADPKFQADYRTALAKEQWPSPPVAGMDAASPAPSEVEDRLQDLAHRLTTQRDELQAAYDKLGPLLVAQAQENVALRALLLTADEAEALLDLIIESDHPATEPWGTIADKLVGQRDRNQTS